jgi:HD superfamily phosphohydrolase
MTGTRHAGIDFEWLMENLEIGEVPYGVDATPVGRVQTFVLGKKAVFAAEAYVLGLFQLYPTVYFHKATRAAEHLCCELLSRVIRLVKDGSIVRTGLPPNHPLIRFAQNPDSLECALALDDTVVWGALPLLVESLDICIADLATRLRDRALYKCVDVRAAIARRRGDDASSSAEGDTVCARVRERIAAFAAELSSRNPDAAPRVLIDEAERSPYKRMTEDSKGPLSQINIHTEGDRLDDLARRSKVVAELKNYKAFRVYCAGGDVEASRGIEQIITGGIEEWPG